MVQKRHFDDEEILEISSKYPRSLDGRTRLVSFSESDFPGYTWQKPHILEDGSTKDDIESDEKLSSGFSSEPGGSISMSSWATSSTSEEDCQAEEPIHYSFFPEYFTSERHIRTVHCEDVYSTLLSQPPQKSVAVGPDHQADVPQWRPRPSKTVIDHLGTSGSVSDSDNIFGDDNEKRLMGTCVIPMPDMVNTDIVGCGRTNCSCSDSGSRRCVNHHIAEAREKLAQTTGPKKFEELGFSDMGEQVAHKWSEEEEQLFHEVVFSNPASLGKNFWDNLSVVFPCRTKKGIVSYYFNVFMLRKRAEQNRTESLEIDSDNDEWQRSDDFGENEVELVEEDVDSVVESPLDQGEHDHDQCSEGEVLNIENPGSGDTISIPRILLPDKIEYERRDHVAQDDSYPSTDTGTASQGTQAKMESSVHWENNINGSSRGGVNEYIVEPDYAKGWDSRYLTCFKTEVDFLPTCSMIKEVFGDELCNYKVRDDKNLR